MTLLPLVSILFLSICSLWLWVRCMEQCICISFNTMGKKIWKLTSKCFCYYSFIILKIQILVEFLLLSYLKLIHWLFTFIVILIVLFAVRELDVPGEIYERKTYPFEFSTVEMPYETYNGVNVRLRYVYDSILKFSREMYVPIIFSDNVPVF